MTIAAYKTIGNVRKAMIGLLLVGASCVSSQASATSVLFNFTGSATASFTLLQSPTPSFVNPNNFGFNSVAGTFQGAPALLGVGFGTGGDFNLASGMTYVMGLPNGLPGGTNLFSGTTAAPTFNLGTYSFFGDIVTQNDGAPTHALGNFSLSITSVSDAVPEPSTWMMMIAGFGLLGGAMRYGNNTRIGAKTASLT